MFDARFIDDGKVMLQGRLDASQTDKVKALLAGISSSCIVDFGELEYISSAGLGVLLAIQQRLKTQGQGLRLVHMNKHIREIFTFTGFDRIFDVE